MPPAVVDRGDGRNGQGVGANQDQDANVEVAGVGAKQEFPAAAAQDVESKSVMPASVAYHVLWLVGVMSSTATEGLDTVFGMMRRM